MNNITLLILTVYLIFSLSLVSSITASLGNSRMVLSLEPGETREKTLLVKNVNDVGVRIEMVQSGDLEDYIEIKDNNFTLAPGEEKKARFTIQSPVEGTSTSNIYVIFIPENGNSVGLIATVIINAGNSSQAVNKTEIQKNSDLPSSLSSLTTLFNFRDKNTTNSSQSQDAAVSISPLILLSISSLILLILLIILLLYATKRKKRVKGAR